MPDIETPVSKLKDVDKEAVRFHVTIHPRVGIFHLIVLLWGRHCGGWFPRSNRASEITILAHLIQFVLESAALRALIEKTISPVLVVFRTEEIVVRDAFITVPVPADNPALSPEHGYSIS